jgi:predicted TIM-barrel fold metal-dependent hydrolase
MFPVTALDDEEGERIPPGLPPVIDAHVHLFPDRVFEAVWRWFDKYGWPIRYKIHSRQVVEFLLSRGISRVVALHYSHQPGMARALNEYAAEIARAEPRVIALATVLPGEPGAVQILEDAFRAGLKGVKLHCHVQCFSPDAAPLDEIYQACELADKPIVIHAGREPSNPHYRCDTREVCSAERIERVLQDHPRLKLCVPHLGADEFRAYERLLERHDRLWLDTTMMLADYFPFEVPIRLFHCRRERIMYGTDFPNVPYAWDRELRKFAGLALPPEHQARILSENAIDFFGIR